MRTSISSASTGLSPPSTSGRCTEFLPAKPLAKPAFFGSLPAPGLQRSKTLRPLTIAASLQPRKEMSMQQRMRALKFAIEDKKKELAKSPPIAAVLSILAAIRAKLQPLFDFYAKMQRTYEAYGEAYNQFLAEETKEKWTWSKRNKKELELLASVPNYVLAFACTLAYQAFTPVSFLCCFLLPLYFSWALWDQWWVSPVFLGSILMAPLKFAPWGWMYFSWVWPGLI